MSRRNWLKFVILLCFSASGAVLAAERPVLKEVVALQEGNGARIEIKADLPLTYSSYLMPELAKWVIDLPGATTDYPDDESKRMRTPPLERITVRQKDVNGDLFTRIGLDFTGDVVFSIKTDPLDKSHLVVSISPSKTTPQKPGAVASVAALPQVTPGAPETASGSAQPAGAPPGPGTAAKTVTSVRITADSIRIEADGRVTIPAPLALNRPGRLVLDLTGVASGLDKVPVPANRFGVVRCRLGKNADKLRIVFEVSGDTFPDFQVKEISNGVEIFPLSNEKRKNGS